VKQKIYLPFLLDREGKKFETSVKHHPIVIDL